MILMKHNPMTKLRRFKNARPKLEAGFSRIAGPVRYSESARAELQIVVVGTLVAGTLLCLTPSELATAANLPSSEAIGSFMADTGISKVRSGKAVIRAATAKTPVKESVRLSLEGFRVEGDPRLMPEALDGILAPWKGRSLSFPEYEQAIHAVAAYLRKNGHPGAEVRMSRAMVGQGTVMIAIEGLSPTVPAIASAEVTPKVEVKSFKFSGATLAPEAELQALLANLSGKPLTAAEMEQAAQSVANHLRAKGYPLVQAYLPPQRVDGGVIEIAVQEGRLDANSGNNGLTISGGGARVKPEVMEAFLIRGAKPDSPLRMADLERAVLLANDLPGVKSVKTEIQPGTQAGTTQIKATVEEARVVGATVAVDNYGSRYTGEGRILGQLQLNSPAGYGEQYSLNTINSSNMQSVRVGAQAPIGSSGFRVGASYLDMTSKFGLTVAVLGLNSKAQVGNVFASYPLIRSAETNLNATASYDDKHFITDLNWARENDRRVKIGTLALSGDLLDRWGGQTRWSTSVGVGNTDLSAHALNQSVDAVTAQTQGSFTKTGWQATRSAALPGSTKWSWQVAMSGQGASKNLDSSEKFQLGGPSGVRAYPVGEGLGDKAVLATAEIGYRVGETRLGVAQLFGFYDAGWITQFASPWTGALPTRPNSYSLKGAGFGGSLNFGDKGGVKLMWANKIGSNPNPTVSNTDADGQTKSGRVWIIGNIVF